MICLAAAGLLVQLGAAAVTLRWTHSVEKTIWEEDWRDSPAGLEIAAARVQGSGAGMDPAPDARFSNGAWTWTPHVPPIREVVLRRSGATMDWFVCIHGSCKPMAAYVGPRADPIALRSCSTGSQHHETSRWSTEP